MNLMKNPVIWIVDNLSDKTLVLPDGCQFSVLSVYKCAPQGCILEPLVFLRM